MATSQLLQRLHLLQKNSYDPTKFTSKIPKLPFSHLFTTSSKSNKPNTKVNFTPLNSSDSEPEPEPDPAHNHPPPPYDPFNKKPISEEPQDPKNLAHVFHKMRSDGLMSNAVKMFDELSKDGLTHEALDMFRDIKDKGKMPDVVAHTAVIEAYANAGQCKEAHKVYLRMLACGVLPNAYTYSVLIKSLAGGQMLEECKKYVLEMLGKGMKLNVGTCVSVFEAFWREGKEEDGRELIDVMKEKGYVVDEKGVREALKGKRGPIIRFVKSVLFAK